MCASQWQFSAPSCAGALCDRQSGFCGAMEKCRSANCTQARLQAEHRIDYFQSPSWPLSFSPCSSPRSIWPGPIKRTCDWTTWKFCVNTLFAVSPPPQLLAHSLTRHRRDSRCGVEAHENLHLQALRAATAPGAGCACNRRSLPPD